VPPTGSRFRAANTPGLWYEADDAFCACAEVAYWRQRFLLDSAGLVKGVAINLLAPPWAEASALWTDPVDCTQTQRLGGLARDAGPGDVFERAGAV
jgi:hypothetical protein